MIATVQKWGNSLGVRIPRLVAADIAIRAGSAMELSADKGRLVLTPVRDQELTLAALLEGVSPQNRHAETDTGPARGQEAW